MFQPWAPRNACGAPTCKPVDPGFVGEAFFAATIFWLLSSPRDLLPAYNNKTKKNSLFFIRWLVLIKKTAKETVIRRVEKSDERMKETMKRRMKTRSALLPRQRRQNLIGSESV